MQSRDEFDSPWKEIVNQYFEQFVRFFFPNVAEEIEWKKGYASLDKELRQITREAEIGSRLVDNLLKVWKKTGEETWVLIHVEIQAQHKEDFSHRTYVYNYRIHDLYNRPVASFAVLADDNPSWCPDSYSQELWGCSTEFRSPVVKLLDYVQQQQTLETSQNHFAIVVLAHLKTLETKKDSDGRRHWKVRLTKELYRRGFTKGEIVSLYRFIDWIMVLPKELEQQFHREIMEFEEEQKMQYITTAERIGIEKGRKEGLEQGEKKGLEKGTIIGEILFAQKMMKLAIYTWDELKTKHLDDLNNILAKMEAQLQEQDTETPS